MIKKRSIEHPLELRDNKRRVISGTAFASKLLLVFFIQLVNNLFGNIVIWPIGHYESNSSG